MDDIIHQDSERVNMVFPMHVFRLIFVCDNDRASPPEPVGSFDWRRGEGT